MIFGLLLAALTSAPSCWDVYDAAVAHSAQAPHPAYFDYDERISITEDRQPFLSSRARIRYWENGTARIEDERFGYTPILTNRPEPGPPDLGPYGKHRSAWLPMAGSLRVIATTRAKGRIDCALSSGVYKGRDTYHLSFTGADPSKPHLNDLWIDMRTLDIWKVRMAAPGYVEADGSAAPLADYEIELGYHGPYLVVEHVTWDYSLHDLSQSSTFVGEYTMNNYQFSPSGKSSSKIDSM